MNRAAAAAFLFCLFLPASLAAQGDSLEAVEKDLSSILKEMDAMSSELDRIQDLAAAPRATAIQVVILGGSGIPAPVSGRLRIDGKAEQGREWSRAERDAFAGGSPLSFQAPILPGTYAARFEILHPSWKTAPAADFPASLRKGETFLMKFTLSLPPGKTEPVLAPAKEP